MIDLIGVENLIPNPWDDGGGFDESAANGFFNVHQRFSCCPCCSSWRRQVSLHYPNEDWTSHNCCDVNLRDVDVTRHLEKIGPNTNSNGVLAIWDGTFNCQGGT